MKNYTDKKREGMAHMKKNQKKLSLRMYSIGIIDKNFKLAILNMFKEP